MQDRHSGRTRPEPDGRGGFGVGGASAVGDPGLLRLLGSFQGRSAGATWFAPQQENPSGRFPDIQPAVLNTFEVRPPAAQVARTAGPADPQRGLAGVPGG